MFRLNPLFLIDGYKTGHHNQYVKGTSFVYANGTARNGKYSNVLNSKGIINFGHQYTWRYIHDAFHADFFSQPREAACQEFKEELEDYLDRTVTIDHIYALWDYQKLPIRVKALPEGDFVPYGVPITTSHNTKEKGEFFWFTNFLETLQSSLLWLPFTSATTAFAFRKIGKYYGDLTGAPEWFLEYQFHDFSFRSMGHPWDAIASGMGHGTSFIGTDTLPAIKALKYYYKAKRGCGKSVCATEHSVTSCNILAIEQKLKKTGKWKDTTIEEYGFPKEWTLREMAECLFIKELTTVVYPDGIVSNVSDTYDYAKVISEYSRYLKETITSRNGTLVYRPDTGNPYKIVCGDEDAPEGTFERKGTIQTLWEIFGGTETAKGFKELDSHIKVIYGDSITLDLAERILKRLMEMGFASSNIVFGIGGFSYRYVTRDTHGFAMKATYCIVNDEPVELYKDPKTGKSKKSAKGLLRVEKENGQYVLYDQQTPEQEEQGELKVIYDEGPVPEAFVTLDEICSRIKSLL